MFIVSYLVHFPPKFNFFLIYRAILHSGMIAYLVVFVDAY
jgi:hypothetical protein